MMARTLILPITMGKVDGCRLWSTRLTGSSASVYPDYPCPHTPLALLLFKSTGYPLPPDCGSNSTAKQSNKIVDRHSIPFQTRPYAHVPLIVTTAQTTV